VWLLQGPEKRSGTFLSVAYSGGLERHRIYLANAIFGAGWTERSVGREWLWRVRSRVEREEPTCSLLVYEIEESREPFLAHSPRLRIPVWLKFESPADERGLKPSAKSRRRDMERKIRKYGYTSSASRLPADFEDFYHNMYVPLVRNRYGEMGGIRPYEAMKKEFQSGFELVFLHMGGKTVAGGLIDHSKTTSRLHSHGVRDGSLELIRMGATDALYYFELKHILEKGRDIVNLGHCRAFFNDGVFRYKLEIGARVGGGHDAPSGLLYFEFLRPTAELMSFLEANPFVALDKDKTYRGVVFMEKAPAIKEIDEALDRKLCRGIENVTLYTTSGQSQGSQRTAQGRLVRFSSVDSLFRKTSEGKNG